MKKLIKGLVMTAIAFTAITFNNTSASAKIITVKEAAQKLYKTEEKAYNTKKDVSVTLKVCAKNTGQFVSKGEKIVEAFENIDKFYFATYAWGSWKDDTFKYKGSESRYISRGENMTLDHLHWVYNDGWNDQYVSEGHYNAKKDIAVYKITFLGSKEGFREEHELFDIQKYLAEEIREYTSGMNDLDKAMAVADWICKRMKYDTEYGIPWKGLYDWETTGKKAVGVCSSFAETYVELAAAAGLQRVFCISSEKIHHAFNCVEVDGVMRYFDLTYLETGNADYVGDARSVDEYRSRCTGDSYDEYYARLSGYYRYKDGASTESAFNTYLKWYDEEKSYGEFSGYPWEVSRAEYYLKTLNTFLGYNNKYKGATTDDWVHLNFAVMRQSFLS